jgi:hypothetical protein
MEYPDCLVRVVLKGEECCLHHRTDLFKKPVTPEICNSCEHQFDVDMSQPSPLQKMANVAKAGAQAVRNPKFASEEEQARRRAICADCDHLVNTNTCTVCGCNLKYKTKLEVWKCDIGKWD